MTDNPEAPREGIAPAPGDPLPRASGLEQAAARCGYTAHDAAYLMDHHLCRGEIPALRKGGE